MVYALVVEVALKYWLYIVNFAIDLSVIEKLLHIYEKELYWIDMVF